MASNNSLFASLTDSEIRIFQNHSRSPARGLKLLNKSIFTEENETEFAKIVKLMIKAACSSNTLAPKSQMEVFGQKLSDSFATKRIHLKVAVDFLMLSQHISDFLPLHVEPPPSPLPPLKDYSSDDDTDTETPPTMSAFDVALEGGSKPKASSVRSSSPTRSVSPAPRSARPRDLPAPRSVSPAPRSVSPTPRSVSPVPRSASPDPTPRTRSTSPGPRGSCSRDRTRSRSPLQTERSRASNTPKETKKGEKSKKRNRSVSSSLVEREEEKRSHSSERSHKKKCVWNDMSFSLAKKIKGKYFKTNFILFYIP